MQVLGHINGIAHHERNRPAPPDDTPTMKIEGRRKVVAALVNQGWSTTDIAEALGISAVVITVDLADIDIDVPDSPAAMTPTIGGKTQRVALLEAYADAPRGMTAPEAGAAAGLDRYAASKRVPELRKQHLIKALLNEHDMPVQRDKCTVHVITQAGRDSLTDQTVPNYQRAGIG